MKIVSSRQNVLQAEVTLYECGELSREDTRKLFQTLIQTGAVWQMERHYQKMAEAYIQNGECSRCAA